MRLRPDAILFDLDGTLVDGRDAIWDAFDHALRADGRAPVLRERVEALIGHPLDAMFLSLAEGASAADAARLVDAYRARFELRARGLVRPTPGAREALARLAGTPLAVVTTKMRAPALLVLEATGMLDAFAAVVAREDATRMKPHPEPVWEAAKRLGVDARRCALVGDTPLDVRAARAAGARSVGVLCGHGTEAELRAAGAETVIPDLSRLEEAW